MNPKKIYSIIGFCLAMATYGQTQMLQNTLPPFSGVNNSFLLTNTVYTNYTPYSFKQLDYKLLYDNSVFKMNRGGVVTDNYRINADNSFTYINSYVDQDNVFRKLKTDSFNPNRVSQAWEGVVAGLLNTVFSK